MISLHGSAAEYHAIWTTRLLGFNHKIDTTTNYGEESSEKSSQTSSENKFSAILCDGIPMVTFSNEVGMWAGICFLVGEIVPHHINLYNDISEFNIIWEAAKEPQGHILSTWVVRLLG